MKKWLLYDYLGFFNPNKEVKNECNERKLEDLEDRLFKAEQYSSRATVIHTGVEVMPDEDVSSKVSYAIC